MSTKDEAGRLLVFLAMILRAVRIRQLLSEFIPILLVFRSVMSEAGKNGLVATFGLAGCLRLVPCGR